MRTTFINKLMEIKNIKSYERTLRFTRYRYKAMTMNIDGKVTWENLSDSVKNKLYFNMDRNLYWQNDDFAISIHIAANNFSEEANVKIISAFVKKLNEKLLGRKYWKLARDEQFSCEIFKQGGGDTGVDTHYHCLIRLNRSRKVKNSLYSFNFGFRNHAEQYDFNDVRRTRVLNGINLGGDIELLTYLTMNKIIEQFNNRKRSQAIGSAIKKCKTLKEVEEFDDRSVSDCDQVNAVVRMCRQANDYEHDQQVYCSRYVNDYSYGDVKTV